jgi:hypothetical protein
MTGFTTAQTDALTRAELWSRELKEVLQDELMAQRYVKWMTEFPDGTTFTIPSIGDLDAQDYLEDTAVEYSAMDTGEFQFTINQYKQSGTYITNKAKQDSFYAGELIASFVPKMSRAIMVDLEKNILKEGQPKAGNPAGYQVPGNTNSINGQAHRWVGSATVNTVRTLGVEDFARANLALTKANVPMGNRVAIVDPSVAYVLETVTNLTNISDNPRYEGLVTQGMMDATGMQFVRNIYGFDVYTSNYLPLSGADQSGASETISTVASGANAVSNLFFSATPDVLPFVGAWRQMPKVDGEYNKDFQREEFVTTARYGLKIYRPENLVTVLSQPGVVA